MLLLAEPHFDQLFSLLQQLSHLRCIAKAKVRLGLVVKLLLILVLVMACCLTSPSHYLNLCWLSWIVHQRTYCSKIYSHFSIREILWECLQSGSLVRPFCLRIIMAPTNHWHFDGWVQNCSNSSALAMESLQSCAKPLTCIWRMLIIPIISLLVSCHQDSQAEFSMETKARVLSRKVWELFMVLPTNMDMLQGFKAVGQDEVSRYWGVISSLTPGKFEWNFRHVIFKRILVIDSWGISC